MTIQEMGRKGGLASASRRDWTPEARKAFGVRMAQARAKWTPEQRRAVGLRLAAARADKNKSK